LDGEAKFTIPLATFSKQSQYNIRSGRSLKVEANVKITDKKGGKKGEKREKQKEMNKLTNQY
jgi:hypothetical protein